MTMMKQMLSPIGAGITLSALAAAMMSTMDSLLINCASTVENDILVHTFGFELDQKKRIVIARLTTLVIGIISVIWGLYPPKLLALLLYPAWGVLGLTFAAAFYGGLYWKRFNAPGIITAMIAGSVTFVAWHLMGNPLGIYHIQAALIVSIPLTIIVTYMTPPTSDKVLAQFFDANTNSKSASMN